jgi:hypothetical protein
MKKIESAFPSSDARAKLRCGGASAPFHDRIHAAADLDRRGEERPGHERELDEDHVDDEDAGGVRRGPHVAEVHNQPGFSRELCGRRTRVRHRENDRMHVAAMAIPCVNISCRAHVTFSQNTCVTNMTSTQKS